MIRRMQRADIDRVADIWLDTNIRAHNFISKQYWQNNFSIPVLYGIPVSPQHVFF